MDKKDLLVPLARQACLEPRDLRVSLVYRELEGRWEPPLGTALLVCKGRQGLEELQGRKVPAVPPERTDRRGPQDSMELPELPARTAHQELQVLLERTPTLPRTFHIHPGGTEENLRRRKGDEGGVKVSGGNEMPVRQ
mmetsp:Transcript_39823/g.125097  ORF Transcript_39823/g.125097 Transcript_39823/m.125097 type:complete len:138 (-) Transcript_39823:1668-2081(-)